MIDVKKKAETDILFFVKNNSKEVVDETKNGVEEKTQWYVQLPQHLVSSAIKTNIWNIENYLFKYKNWTLVALSTWNLSDIDLNFENKDIKIKYEALTPLRENLTKEEISILDRVDFTHKRLEDIRSLQSSWAEWFNTHEDDLWIPIELEKEISDKRLEREKIKDSLTYMSPLSSKSVLQDNWEDYYNYFEWTYIGMLATISQFNISDDLSNIWYMSQAWSWIQTKENIVEVQDWKIALVSGLNLEEDEKTYLSKYIKEIKDPETWKTAEELLLDKNNENWEEKRWKWIVRQILIAILEAETVVFDDQQNVVWIGCNVDYVNEDQSVWEKAAIAVAWWPIWTGTIISNEFKKGVSIEKSKTKMEERIDYYLSSWSPSIDKDNLSTLDTDKINIQNQKIRTVSITEKKSYQKINSMVDNIISTVSDVDWAWRRWTPKFIPNLETVSDNEIPWKFRSWDHSISITVYPWEIVEKTIKPLWTTYKTNTDYLKIKWLDIQFDNIEDGMRMANLINWIEWYYLQKNPEARGDFHFDGWALQVDDSYINDTDILYESTINQHYSELKSESNQYEVIKYLNSL